MTSHYGTIQGTYTVAPQHRLPMPPVKTYSDGIDWIAVERAARGELRADALTQAESREAALWLAQAGASRSSISVQLCVYERLVKEWMAEAGLLADCDLCSQPECRRATAGRGLCAICLSHQRVLERQAKKAEMAVAA